MKIPRASAVVSTVFGIGYFSVAQGTIMSAIALPIAILLAINAGGYVGVGGTAILALVIGILSCNEYVRESGNEDPSECVIDELAGQLLASAFVSFGALSIPAFFLSFALFRLFDIWKPWPVSWAEDELHGGLAVMMDDIVAGVMAGIPCFIVHYFHLFNLF
jgi:phosphatidylglycerophosphatase A